MGSNGQPPRYYNLGCGRLIQPRPYINLDLKPGPGVDGTLDLNTRGWGAQLYPAQDIMCTDVVEHLNSAIAFFDECWQALVPGGTLRCKIGGAGNPTIWTDPTHKRGYNLDSFDFLDPDTDWGTRYPHYTERKWRIVGKELDQRTNVIIVLTPRKERTEGSRWPAREREGMPKLEIVLPYSGWILEDMARHLCELDGYSVRVVNAPDGWGDIAYHLPWHTLIHKRSGSRLDVACFTHVNPGQGGDLLAMAGNADAIVTMSRDSLNVVRERGVETPARCIYPGVLSEFKPRPVRVGINGRPYGNGRKREWILQELAWRMDLSGFQFVILGPGWEDVVATLRQLGVEVEWRAELEYAVYPDVMRSLDVYLATGFVEGCGRGAQEALASGVPVLSRRTGIAADYPDGCEYFDTVDELARLLKGHARRPAQAWSWAEYVAAHAALFGELLHSEG